MEFEMREIIHPSSRMDMRFESAPVTEKAENEQFLWEWLEYVTEEADNCLGMAGCQIGINERAFYLPLVDQEPVRFRNPEIIRYSKQRRVYKDEGCMSFPGQFIDTLRHVWVEVKDDINGTKVYKGQLGICVQHEMDHLDGVLIFDRKAHSTYIRGGEKIGRNDLCVCNSGKKYKKCCGG